MNKTPSLTNHHGMHKETFILIVPLPLMFSYFRRKCFYSKGNCNVAYHNRLGYRNRTCFLSCTVPASYTTRLLDKAAEIISELHRVYGFYRTNASQDNHINRSDNIYPHITILASSIHDTVCPHIAQDEVFNALWKIDLLNSQALESDAVSMGRCTDLQGATVRCKKVAKA
jgi:hypothetical protein